MNLKARRDYIETDYINGVKDEHGNMVMRPLTDKEKDFLAQFYKETVNADKRGAKFYKDKEDWKDIYNENNARNRCLYNQAKKTGSLKKFETKDSDKKLIKGLGDYDAELLIIHKPDKDIDKD